MIESTPHNPKGCFEGLLDGAVIRNIFRLKSVAENHTNPKTEKTYMAQECPELEMPWFVKTPNIVYHITHGLIWPTWRQHFPNAKWVIVRRNREDIRASQQAAYGRNGFPNTRKVLEQLEAIEASGVNYREIWPFRSLTPELTEYKALIEWLGLEWNDAAVRAFIDPTLYHFKSDPGPSGPQEP
jgi:hypothetical protein